MPGDALQHFKHGDLVDFPTFNKLIDGHARQIIGIGVIQTPNGWAIVMPDGGGPAVAIASAGFAIITSRAGTAPPWRYSASQATMDINGLWTQLGGGAAYSNVFNLEEQGTGGQWVNPINNGDVVVIYAGPNPAVAAFVCHRSHYRGTY